jgi:hypothetical protein
MGKIFPNGRNSDDVMEAVLFVAKQKGVFIAEDTVFVFGRGQNAPGAVAQPRIIDYLPGKEMKAPLPAGDKYVFYQVKNGQPVEVDYRVLQENELRSFYNQKEMRKLGYVDE